MSTPGERLKKLGQQLNQQREERQKKDQEAESAKRAREREISQRIRTVGYACLQSAQKIRDDAGYRIALHLDTDSPDAFALVIGQSGGSVREIRASLGDDRWNVEAVNARGHAVHKYFNSDEEFRKSFDELLEPLMEEALRALMNEEEEPSPER